jgi:uncharacterized protein
VEESFVDATPWTRFVIKLRSRLTPYQSMAAAFPNSGRIVDLGCGWGLLSFALCNGSPDREIVGVDHDPGRIGLAARAARKFPSACHLSFQSDDVVKFLEAVPTQSLAGIAMIDLLHYFDRSTQRSLIVNAFRVLGRGGVLLVRDIDSADGLRATLNKLYERIATRIGFTMTSRQPLFFDSRAGWIRQLHDAGFDVSSLRSGPVFFADVLFVARRIL